jgi:rsbT co-antagonist protein RsbR
MKESELREQSRQFLSALREAVEHGSPTDIQSANWAGMRELLAGISHSRAQQGFTPSETATFVFSVREPVLTRLRQELAKQPDGLVEEIGLTMVLLDKLGLYTTEVHQKSREEIIARQQQELLELSTPVVHYGRGSWCCP